MDFPLRDARPKALMRGLFWSPKWRLLIKLKLNNRTVNRLIRPATAAELDALPIPKFKLNLTLAEYKGVLGCSRLQRRFAKFDYAHSKVLEYLTSIRLLDPAPGSNLLDAASGKGEFLETLQELRPDLNLYAQDPILKNKQENETRCIGGTVSEIPVPDETFDAISCHHSFEHFRGDQDSQFVREALRTLKPGGKLVITPLFLTNLHAEIFNTRRIEHYDRGARTIVDRTSTFCGWGPHEGFARTYDVESFQTRILNEVPTSYRVELFAVSLDGKPAPDMRTNTHLALLNGSMQSLRITKIQRD